MKSIPNTMIPVKILLLSLILFLLGGLTRGQDIIVRNNGDTIRCVVTRIDSNVIYFKLKRQNESVTTSLSRNEIKDFIVPVSPDNPMRILYEKKITRNSILGTAGSLGFVAGGILIISGFSDMYSSGEGVRFFQIFSFNIEDMEQYNNGKRRIVAGIPFTVAGAVIGSLGFSKVVKYRGRLKDLYNVSVSWEYDLKYKGIRLTYKF
jgi:hypothetical protein